MLTSRSFLWDHGGTAPGASDARPHGATTPEPPWDAAQNPGREHSHARCRLIGGLGGAARRARRGLPPPCPSVGPETRDRKAFMTAAPAHQSRKQQLDAMRTERRQWRGEAMNTKKPQPRWKEPRQHHIRAGEKAPGREDVVRELSRRGALACGQSSSSGAPSGTRRICLRPSLISNSSPGFKSSMAV